MELFKVVWDAQLMHESEGSLVKVANPSLEGEFRLDLMAPILGVDDIPIEEIVR